MYTLSLSLSLWGLAPCHWCNIIKSPFPWAPNLPELSSDVASPVPTTSSAYPHLRRRALPPAWAVAFWAEAA